MSDDTTPDQFVDQAQLWLDKADVFREVAERLTLDGRDLFAHEVRLYVADYKAKASAALTAASNIVGLEQCRANAPHASHVWSRQCEGVKP